MCMWKVGQFKLIIAWLKYVYLSLVSLLIHILRYQIAKAHHVYKTRNFCFLNILSKFPRKREGKEMDRFEARGYQLEMLEQSLQENIILVVRQNLWMITDDNMMNYLDRIVRNNVIVEHPRAVLNNLAGSKRVSYNISRNADKAVTYDVSVILGEEEMARVHGCLSKNECIV